MVLAEFNGEIVQDVSSTISFDSDGTAITQYGPLLNRYQWDLYSQDSLYLIKETDTSKFHYRFVDGKLKMEGNYQNQNFYWEMNRKDGNK